MTAAEVQPWRPKASVRKCRANENSGLHSPVPTIVARTSDVGTSSHRFVADELRTSCDGGVLAWHGRITQLRHAHGAAFQNERERMSPIFNSVSLVGTIHHILFPVTAFAAHTCRHRNPPPAQMSFITKHRLISSVGYAVKMLRGYGEIRCFRSSR